MVIVRIHFNLLVVNITDGNKITTPSLRKAGFTPLIKTIIVHLESRSYHFEWREDMKSKRPANTRTKRIITDKTNNNSILCHHERTALKNGLIDLPSVFGGTSID